MPLAGKSITASSNPRAILASRAAVQHPLRTLRHISSTPLRQMTDGKRSSRSQLTTSSSRTPDSDFRAKYASEAMQNDDRLATDFDELDVLSGVPPPSTAVNTCYEDGFLLDNGLRITGGDGCLLVDGEAFRWKPWEGFGGGRSAMLNGRKQFDVPEDVWGILRVIWPKPDLLILGLGATMHPLSPKTREHISSLGIRVDVMDTRNAAAQFNMLATERSVQDVAAALIPVGWTGKH
ncbi:hypothetical protein KEM54_006714 [Ascosphaera aggregata]|nr:hypothetical protein KEM54_006714 [Ascosphaera aggregata]